MSDKHRKRKPKDGSLDLKRSGIRLSKYVDYRYYRFFAPKRVDCFYFYFYFCFLSSAKKRNVFDSREQSRIYSGYAEVGKGAWNERFR